VTLSLLVVVLLAQDGGAAPDAKAAELQPITISDSFTAERVRPDALAFQRVIFENELRRMGVKVVDSGAETSVTVKLEKLGQSGTQVELEAKLAQGNAIAARNVQALNEGELSAMLRMLAREVATTLFHTLNREPFTQPLAELPPPPPEYTSTTPAIGVAAAGAVFLAGGAVMYFFGKQQLSDVQNGHAQSYAAAVSQANTAQLLGNGGLAAMIVGGVALVGGTGYGLIASRRNASLEVSGLVAPGGGAVVIGGRF
jgi:hypothetical protein